MTDQADETIVVRYLVDAETAIERSKAFREEVNAIKVQLKELAKASNVSYKDMAKGMTEAFSSKKLEQLKQWIAKNPLLDSETIKAQTGAVKAEIASYAAAVKTALSEVNAEVRTSNKIWEEAKKGEAIVAKDAAAQIAQAEHEAAAAKKQAVQEWLADSQQQANAMKEVESASKTSAESSEDLGESFGDIVTKGAALAGIGIGFSKIKDYLVEAAQAGKEFAQATFAMVVGIRALQRAGVDITIADMNTQIRALRKEFGVFSTKDLVVGSAAFLNLNRDMGFTKEQLFELQNAIAKLAIINGQAMDEVQKTVALALSSGYTEGLQRLGVSINRVTIAQEAARLGWEGGYTALNEQQRAQATYNLVLRKTAIYQDDIQNYLKTAPGQIDAMNKRLEDQGTILGARLLPLWVKLVTAVSDFVGFVQRDVFQGSTMLEYIKAYVAEVDRLQGIDAWDLAYRSPIGSEEQKRGIEILDKAAQSYSDTVRRLKGELGKEEFKKLFPQEIIAEGIGGMYAGLGDVPIAGLEGEKIVEDIGAAIDEQLDAITAAYEEFQEGSKEAWEDYQEDLEEMEIEHYRRRVELAQDYVRKVLELGIEHQRRMDELELENQRRVDDIGRWYEDAVDALALDEATGAANIWANYYNSLASAEANYRNQQIDAEIKYQETLMRLREGFLLDLEDALQVRDARQVLKLIRRYNLEKEQADRAFDQEMDRLRRQHDERLAELARQRDERLRQFYAELAAKRAALEIEHQRKLDDEQRRFEQEQEDERRRYRQQRIDAKTNWDYAKADEKRRYEQDKIDRATRYNQELIDLQDHLDDRYEAIGIALGKELDLTEEQMGLVEQALNDTLGPGGAAEAIYRYYTQNAIAAMTTAAGAISYILALQSLQHGSAWWNWGDPGVPYPGSVTPQHLPEGFAEGGVAYADEATTVKFGEAGPELATFIPLKGSSSLPGALSQIGKGMGSSSSSGGNMKIELWLDRYLEGRIVDSAVDNVADVILRRFRQ